MQIAIGSLMRLMLSQEILEVNPNPSPSTMVAPRMRLDWAYLAPLQHALGNQLNPSSGVGVKVL